MLTVDSLNLEMMRVDTILENVGEITDSASNATTAVENLTNVPVKAVNNVASRVKTKLGGRTASDESAQLADQREAVARALEDYKAAEAKDAKHAAHAAEAPAPETKLEAAAEPAPKPAEEVPEKELEDAFPSPSPSDYSVIDPQAIEESAFFDDAANDK